LIYRHCEARSGLAESRAEAISKRQMAMITFIANCLSFGDCFVAPRSNSSLLLAMTVAEDPHLPLQFLPRCRSPEVIDEPAHKNSKMKRLRRLNIAGPAEGWKFTLK